MEPARLIIHSHLRYHGGNELHDPASPGVAQHQQWQIRWADDVRFGESAFHLLGIGPAYIFMNLAMLFSAMAFTGNRLENRIRRLFILNGVSGLVILVSAFWIATNFI